MTSAQDIAVVRNAIYAGIVERGVAPSVGDVAAAHAIAEADVADAYRALADGHVIVLQTGTLDVRWAPPFSAVPAPFQVRAGRSSWYAPCAWDAFGIPAALDVDARIDATCAWSGEALHCAVEHGHAFGTGVIHLLVPAAHFWDDIGYT
jgi:hypothetical protein